MKYASILLLVILSGCTSIVPSKNLTTMPTKNWTADRFDSRTRILLAQIGLRSEGYNYVNVDGMNGPKTDSAALSFRKARNLPQSDKINDMLVESIFKDHNFQQPMPYIEGSIRSCLRWGPEKVLIMASNAGTMTCSVRGSKATPSKAEIVSAKQFCEKSLRIKSDLVQCELIFDGSRVVGEKHLISMIKNPSPDIPVVIEVSDSARGTHTSFEAVLRSEATLHYFSSSVSDMSVPRPTEKPIEFSLLAGPAEKKICLGLARHKSPTSLTYAGKCFTSKDEEMFEGEAILVGFSPHKGRLLPAYESRVMQQDSQVKIRPPDNVMRF
jgi:hypothetical protein